MKKAGIISLVLLLFILGFMIFGQNSSPMSVQVKETQARDKPSYLGKVVAVIRYGDKVNTEKLQSGWYQIVLPDGSGHGWVQSSALIKKKIMLNAGDTDVKKYASSDDVVLAGKGFNKQVEDQYKDEKNLDFSLVDQMEKIFIPVDEMEEFLQNGRLNSMEGGE